MDIKRAWWRQFLNDDFRRTYPQVKMINWFEWQKYEVEIKDTIDWRGSGSSAVHDALEQDLPDWIHFADSLRACLL